VLIESIPNQKTNKKPNVRAYYRFYVPVIVGQRLFAMRIVAEEKKGAITVNPTATDIYDVIIERKSRSANGLAKKQIPERAGSGSFTISIRDMLQNVKDGNQNPYIDAQGNGIYRDGDNSPFHASVNAKNSDADKIQGSEVNKEKAVTTITNVLREQVEEYIDNAINRSNSSPKMPLWTIGKEEAKELRKYIPLNLTGYQHVLVDNDIRHIINRHSKDEMPIDTREIKKLVDVLSAPTSISRGSLSAGGEATIRFQKEYSDGEIIVVEAIANKQKKLLIKTMWKKPATGARAPKNSTNTSESANSLILPHLATVYHNLL
jgi:hypothetical protein